ncbi:MAG: metallophosphoesterase [Spirochaetes bacterium]|nr:metallophosphoesterase [Spirochaetota bacterium]
MDAVFAHITDLHLDDSLAKRCGIDARKNIQQILNDIRSRGIGTLVMTGDFGSSDSLGWLFDLIRSLGMAHYITLGNHDEVGSFREIPDVPERLRGSELSYTIETGDNAFIFIDTSSGVVGPAQLRWLGEQIVDARKRIVLFSHHPVFDCGNTAMDRLYHLKNREEVGRLLLESGKAITLFCGHYHTSHMQTIGGITQYVTQSALVQVKRDSEIIELESLRYGYRTVKIDGGTIITKKIEFA